MVIFEISKKKEPFEELHLFEIFKVMYCLLFVMQSDILAIIKTNHSRSNIVYFGPNQFKAVAPGSGKYALLI